MDYFQSEIDCLKDLNTDILNNIGNVICQILKEGHSIYLVGNGGSFANALHWQCDLEEVIYRYKLPGNVYTLESNLSIVTAVSNDYCFSDLLMIQLIKKAQAKDLLIVLSSSGNSENLVKATKYSAKNGIKIICIVGDFNGRVLEEANIGMVIPSKDYGIIEDIQISIGHYITHMICEELI